MNTITTIKGYTNHGITTLSRLNRTPAARLAYFRALAPVVCGDWRKARSTQHVPETSALSPGFNSKTTWAWGKATETRRQVWYSHDQQSHFRNEQCADNVDGAGIDNKGWYSDADCDETIRGIVACLNHGRFIAGYHMSMNGERVYFAKVFDCEKEAARYADGEAETLAEEEEKEYSERYRKASDQKDEADRLETDIKELIPMRHHARARRELVEAITDLRNVRETLASEFADIEV